MYICYEIWNYKAEWYKELCVAPVSAISPADLYALPIACLVTIAIASPRI